MFAPSSEANAAVDGRLIRLLALLNSAQLNALGVHNRLVCTGKQTAT